MMCQRLCPVIFRRCKLTLTIFILTMLLIYFNFHRQSNFSNKKITHYNDMIMISTKPSLTKTSLDLQVLGLRTDMGVCTKGHTPWNKDWLISELVEFMQVYNKRIRDNYQGTPLMHQFAIWCLVRHLNPRHIIESGVWRGLGTWILRQAAPDAQLIMLDPNSKMRLWYVDNKTDSLYLTGEKFRDFGSMSFWDDIDIDFSETLAFIDDHNTPFKRIHQARRVGIRHMIFEDNYWLGYSDCFSLKQGCACLMDEPECKNFRYKDNWAMTNRTLKESDIMHAAKTFRDIKTYKEFPMIWDVYREGVTMFSAKSTNYLFPTKNGHSLLQSMGLERLPEEKQMNGTYTYCNIAYVELHQ